MYIWLIRYEFIISPVYYSTYIIQCVIVDIGNIITAFQLWYILCFRRTLVNTSDQRRPSLKIYVVMLLYFFNKEVRWPETLREEEETIKIIFHNSPRRNIFWIQNHSLECSPTQPEWPLKYYDILVNLMGCIGLKSSSGKRWEPPKLRSLKIELN